MENVHYSNKATESAPGLHSELWIIITVDSVAQNLVREKHLFLGKKSSRCCELSDWLFDERSSDSVIGALLVSLAVQCWSWSELTEEQTDGSGWKMRHVMTRVIFGEKKDIKPGLSTLLVIMCDWWMLLIKFCFDTVCCKLILHCSVFNVTPLAISNVEEHLWI